MKVLVTGANGFLGVALVSKLLANTDFYIRCLVRPGSDTGKLQQTLSSCYGRWEIVYGALNNIDHCLQSIEDVDLVFHLASAKSGAPAEMFQGSSVATRVLLEAIRKTEARVKLIHCSSFSVYGVAGLGQVFFPEFHLPLYPG